jgi:hypothetical protein
VSCFIKGNALWLITIFVCRQFFKCSCISAHCSLLALICACNPSVEAEDGDLKAPCSTTEHVGAVFVYQQHHNMESTGHHLHPSVIGPATFVDCRRLLLDMGGSPVITHASLQHTQLCAWHHLRHSASCFIEGNALWLITISETTQLVLAYELSVYCRPSIHSDMVCAATIFTILCHSFSRHPGAQLHVPFMSLVCFCGTKARSALTLGTPVLSAA